MSSQSDTKFYNRGTRNWDFLRFNHQPLCTPMPDNRFHPFPMGPMGIGLLSSRQPRRSHTCLITYNKLFKSVFQPKVAFAKKKSLNFNNLISSRCALQFDIKGPLLLEAFKYDEANHVLIFILFEVSIACDKVYEIFDALDHFRNGLI